MCHVTEDWKSELFQGPFCLENTLQHRNDAIQSGIFLSRLIQTAKIVDRVEDLIRDLSEVRLFEAVTEQVCQNIDGVRVLQRVESG